MVDVEKNSAELKIDADIYLKILSKAIEQTEGDISAFEKALTAGDADTVQRLSHRWKGDYANLRIMALSDIAKEINDLVKTSSRIEESVAERYGSFKAAFEGVKSELNGKI